jgi:hypothetical protein
MSAQSATSDAGREQKRVSVAQTIGVLKEHELSAFEAQGSAGGWVCENTAYRWKKCRGYRSRDCASPLHIRHAVNSWSARQRQCRGSGGGNAALMTLEGGPALTMRTWQRRGATSMEHL